MVWIIGTGLLSGNSMTVLMTKASSVQKLQTSHVSSVLDARIQIFPITDDMPPREEERTLDVLQAYIGSKKLRLEREVCQFWAKEIVVNIEYKYCPNLTIIDTPGLISAAPGRKTHALQSQARAVEAFVRSKMQ